MVRKAPRRCAYCEGEVPEDAPFDILVIGDPRPHRLCSQECVEKFSAMHRALGEDRAKREAEEAPKQSASPLTPEKLIAALKASLFNAEELANDLTVKAQGLMVRVVDDGFRFHKAKLEGQRATVLTMLAELPDPYFHWMSEVGGSLFFMGQRRDATRWTSNPRHIEALCGMAIGLGVARLGPAERGFWPLMPKGVPFLVCLEGRSGPSKIKMPARG